MPTATDMGQVSPDLKGSPKNPARDPKSKDKVDKGSIGDRALMDAVMLIVGALALLVLLWYSVRNHNI
ncbi:MAG TPA: hypothetical protein VN039_01685 [Nitrospira sp.]|nr:hypothetical protein [Nitrospira sp.]